MSVHIGNRSGKMLGLNELRGFARQILAQFDRSDGLSIVFLSDEEMTEFNRKYLGRDRPTDVLAFPDSPFPTDGEAYLGDILISVDTANRQAARRGHTLSIEIKTLIIHGFLHLLGFEHDQDDNGMETIEKGLREELAGDQGPPLSLAHSTTPA